MGNPSTALAQLREIIEELRAAARELRDQGTEPRDIARAVRLPEEAVNDLLSDRASVSPATTRELLQRARQRGRRRA